MVVIDVDRNDIHIVPSTSDSLGRWDVVRAFATTLPDAAEILTAFLTWTTVEIAFFNGAHFYRGRAYVVQIDQDGVIFKGTGLLLRS
jgi:hypothetical protein